MRRTRGRDGGTGVLAPGLLWSTLGSFALVFLAAFESLAVTTVMPVVSDDLDGAALYALAFAGPLATGVVGMVAAGGWADRSGPSGPLYAAVVCFVAGLLVCGVAPSMEVLTLGRLVHGLGGGAINVALYVLVGRLYPARLHARILALFSAAWVLPSLVGPVAAGLVADVFGWRWVFLGVVALVAAATAMMVPALRAVPPRDPGPDPDPDPEPALAPEPGGLRRAGQRRGPRRLAYALLAAAAVLGLDRLGSVPDAGPWLAATAGAVALTAVAPLLPRGTLAARRGLPSVILLRGLVGAAFFASEVYLPYLLVERHGFPPPLAGLALTLAALTWASGSAVQERFSERLADAAAARAGAAMVFAAITLLLSATLAGWPAAVGIAAWGLAGGGMGLLYPRLGVMMLADSTPADQGFNSSALSISDSLGGAMALAAAGIAFAAFAGAGLSFAAVLALSALVALGAVAVSSRVLPAS